jgi:hypothetical protein
MNNFEEIKGLPVNLFPHSCLPEPVIKKILPFFGLITIFQPWFMDRPFFVADTDDINPIQILNPPINLNPGEGFKRLLSECRGWIRNNQEKSSIEFLKACQGVEHNENNTWEIRQMLRRIDRHTSVPEEDHSIRWHLILHLAQEIEDHRREADRMLNALKEKKSPLEGIIEEGADNNINALFEDLPQFESEPIMDENNLSQVLEAWFALFGGHLKGDDFLVTFNQHVMEHVSEFWKDFGVEKKVEASYPQELQGGTLHFIAKHLSPFSNNDLPIKDNVLKHLSNKTIILVRESS